MSKQKSGCRRYRVNPRADSKWRPQEMVPKSPRLMYLSPRRLSASLKSCRKVFSTRDRSACSKQAGHTSGERNMPGPPGGLLICQSAGVRSGKPAAMVEGVFGDAMALPNATF